MQKTIEEYLIFEEKELDNIPFSLVPWERIFFYGDLWSGKSTFIRSILRRHFKNETLVVRSPTYIYYQQYENIFHFDLYRVDSPAIWDSLGGEEILANPKNILLIEWPEVMGDHIVATKKVFLKRNDDGSRTIRLESLGEEHE